MGWTSYQVVAHALVEVRSNVEFPVSDALLLGAALPTRALGTSCFTITGWQRLDSIRGDNLAEQVFEAGISTNGLSPRSS